MSAKPAKRLAVLVSGQGRNLQALLNAANAGRIAATPVAVVSDRPGAMALERARERGMATEMVPPGLQFDAELTAAVARHAPDIVAMAGFMRIVGPLFLETFRGRLLNIHPSLLPRHPGLHTHRRVLAAGETEHGASVHFVTKELDGGPVVIQGRLSVLPQDTERTLAERVMQDIELKIYPQCVAWLARGELSCEADGVRFRGRPLSAPMTLDDLEPEFR